jgi:hypothetical protein
MPVQRTPRPPTPTPLSPNPALHPPTHPHKHNASIPLPSPTAPTPKFTSPTSLPPNSTYLPHRPQPVNKHANTLPYPYPSPTRVCLRFPIGVKQVADADTQRDQLHDQRHGSHGRLVGGVGEWGRKAVLRWRSECECWVFCERMCKEGWVFTASCDETLHRSIDAGLRQKHSRTITTS